MAMGGSVIRKLFSNPTSSSSNACAGAAAAAALHHYIPKLPYSASEILASNPKSIRERTEEVEVLDSPIFHLYQNGRMVDAIRAAAAAAEVPMSSSGMGKRTQQHAIQAKKDENDKERVVGGRKLGGAATWSQQRGAAALSQHRGAATNCWLSNFDRTIIGRSFSTIYGGDFIPAGSIDGIIYGEGRLCPKLGPHAYRGTLNVLPVTYFNVGSEHIARHWGSMSHLSTSQHFMTVRLWFTTYDGRTIVVTDPVDYFLEEFLTSKVPPSYWSSSMCHPTFTKSLYDIFCAVLFIRNRIEMPHCNLTIHTVFVSHGRARLAFPLPAPIHGGALYVDHLSKICDDLFFRNKVPIDLSLMLDSVNGTQRTRKLEGRRNRTFHGNLMKTIWKRVYGKLSFVEWKTAFGAKHVNIPLQPNWATLGEDDPIDLLIIARNIGQHKVASAYVIDRWLSEVWPGFISRIYYVAYLTYPDLREAFHEFELGIIRN